MLNKTQIIERQFEAIRNFNILQRTRVLHNVNEESLTTC